MNKEKKSATKSIKAPDNPESGVHKRSKSPELIKNDYVIEPQRTYATDLAGLRKRPGRPKLFPEPEALWLEFEKYIEWTAARPAMSEKLVKHGLVKAYKPRLLHISAFCLFLGTSPQIFDFHEKNPEYYEVSACIRALIHYHTLDAAMRGEYDSTLTARLLALRDSDDKTPQPVYLSIDEIKKLIADLDKTC